MEKALLLPGSVFGSRWCGFGSLHQEVGEAWWWVHGGARDPSGRVGARVWRALGLVRSRVEVDVGRGAGGMISGRG